MYVISTLVILFVLHLFFYIYAADLCEIDGIIKYEGVVEREIKGSDPFKVFHLQEES